MLRSGSGLGGGMDTERGEDGELRLILVGKSGGGKSATGNTILGRRAFESLLEARTTTLRCQREEGTWQGTKIAVVDTPAMFDSEKYDEILQREIMACVELSWPGPHALIFVTQVGRFTAEDAAAAKCVWDIFGAESAGHTIILFTCAEDLGGNLLDEYVQMSDNRNLRELIQRCGDRFCGFNNKVAGAERESQVSKLMVMVQRTISENGGQHYINRLYQEPNLRDEHVWGFIKRNRKPSWNITNMLLVESLKHVRLFVEQNLKPFQWILVLLLCQVSKLMSTVQRTILENGGRLYVNQLYSEPNVRGEHVRLFVENRKPYQWILTLLLCPFYFACWVCRQMYSLTQRVFLAVYHFFFP